MRYRDRQAVRQRQTQRAAVQATHRQELGEDFDGLGVVGAIRHFVQRVPQLLGHSARQQGAGSHAHGALCPLQMSAAWVPHAAKTLA